MPKIENRKTKALLNAKTPDEYIDKSVKSSLSAPEKAAITKIWLEQNKKYSIKDIEFARNRHPYWKAKKTDNSLERTKNRYQQYAHLANDSYRKKWTTDEIDLFIEKTEILKDYELAELLHKTIPAIQSFRRKIKLIARIKKYKRNLQVRDHIEMAEKVLYRMARELEDGPEQTPEKTSHTKKAANKPARSKTSKKPTTSDKRISKRAK